MAKVQIAKHCAKRLSKKKKHDFKVVREECLQTSDIMAISLQMKSVKDKRNMICSCGPIIAEEKKIHCSVQKAPASLERW